MLEQHRYETILIEKREGITTLTLNRPDRMNAANDVLHSELSTVFRDAQSDADTLVLVLTGAGRAFCAGGDVAPDREYRTKTGLTIMQEARQIVDDILDLEKPLIAAVNGHAVGLGATLATLADVAFVASNARIGDPHVKVAISAGNGSGVIWPLLIGVNRAKYLLMTGTLLNAEEARAIGLVHQVVEPGEVLPSAMLLARQFATGSAFAVQSTKAAINRLIRASSNLVLPVSLALEQIAMQHPDFREALLAMSEKRAPRFTGASPRQEERAQ